MGLGLHGNFNIMLLRFVSFVVWVFDLNAYPGNTECANHENCKEVENPLWCAAAAYSLGANTGSEKPYEIHLWTNGCKINYLKA